MKYQIITGYVYFSFYYETLIISETKKIKRNYFGEALFDSDRLAYDITFV